MNMSSKSVVALETLLVLGIARGRGEPAMVLEAGVGDDIVPLALLN